MGEFGPFDLIIADPPYGDTSLKWDTRIEDWPHRTIEMLKPNGSMWVFGSMRYFLDQGLIFAAAGWKLEQDLVWEKHNGSAFHADRFKRVHENIIQFYRSIDSWSSIYNEVQTTPDAVHRSVHRKKRRPAHLGQIQTAAYHSEDGGPRIMRSVIFMPSMHGHAIHPTEKPSDLIEILIRTSCPVGGLVGDPFAGSGAAGEAALRAGREYLGCEIDPVMALKANDRLRQLLPLN